MSDKIIILGDKDAKRKKIMVVGANDAKPLIESLEMCIVNLSIIKDSFEDELRRTKGCLPIHRTTIDEFRKFGFSAPGDNIKSEDIIDPILFDVMKFIPEMWDDFSPGNGYFMKIDSLFNKIDIIFKDIQAIISTNPELSKQLSVPFAELQTAHLAVIKASSGYVDARKQVQKLMNE